MKRYTIIGMLALLLSSQPAHAEQLIYGVADEWVLIGVLAGGTLILFCCILALAFMLYKAVPMLVERDMHSDN